MSRPQNHPPSRRRATSVYCSLPALGLRCLFGWRSRSTANAITSTYRRCASELRRIGSVIRSPHNRRAVCFSARPMSSNSSRLETSTPWRAQSSRSSSRSSRATSATAGQCPASIRTFCFFVLTTNGVYTCACYFTRRHVDPSDDPVMALLVVVLDARDDRPADSTAEPTHRRHYGRGSGRRPTTSLTGARRARGRVRRPALSGGCAAAVVTTGHWQQSRTVGTQQSFATVPRSATGS